MGTNSRKSLYTILTAKYYKLCMCSKVVGVSRPGGVVLQFTEIRFVGVEVQLGCGLHLKLKLHKINVVLVTTKPI